MQIDQGVLLQAGLVLFVGMVAGAFLVRSRCQKSILVQQCRSRQDRLREQSQWKALLTQQTRDIAAFNQLLRSDLDLLKSELGALQLSGPAQALLERRMKHIEHSVDTLDDHMDDWSEQIQHQPSRLELLPNLGEKLDSVVHA